MTICMENTLYSPAVINPLLEMLMGRISAVINKACNQSVILHYAVNNDLIIT